MLPNIIESIMDLADIKDDIGGPASILFNLVKKDDLSKGKLFSDLVGKTTVGDSVDFLGITYEVLEIKKSSYGYPYLELRRYNRASKKYDYDNLPSSFVSRLEDKPH